VQQKATAKSVASTLSLCIFFVAGEVLVFIIFSTDQLMTYTTIFRKRKVDFFLLSLQCFRLTHICEKRLLSRVACFSPRCHGHMFGRYEDTYTTHRAIVCVQLGATKAQTHPIDFEDSRSYKKTRQSNSIDGFTSGRDRIRTCGTI
jgi:hypothetical protein